MERISMLKVYKACNIPPQSLYSDFESKAQLIVKYNLQLFDKLLNMIKNLISFILF